MEPKNRAAAWFADTLWVQVVAAVVITNALLYALAFVTPITGFDAMLIGALVGAVVIVRFFRRVMAKDRATAPSRMAERFDGSDFVSVRPGGLGAASVMQIADERGYEFAGQAQSEMTFRKRG